MTKDSLNEAIAETERFLKKAKAVKWTKREIRSSSIDPFTVVEYTEVDHVAAAAARRASMDLTRALARMRRY